MALLESQKQRMLYVVSRGEATGVRWAAPEEIENSTASEMQFPPLILEDLKKLQELVNP